MSDAPAAGRSIRNLADAYVAKLADIDPLVAVFLGVGSSSDGLSDLSPEGRAALDDLARATLTQLDQMESAASPDKKAPDQAERRCARLLRERLGTELANTEDDEHLRELVNVSGLQQRVQGVFQLMPAVTEEDWSAIARRMADVPTALSGHRASLTDAARRGQFLAPGRQVNAVAGQLGEWLAAADGDGWFAGFTSAAKVPPSLAAELATSAAAASAAVRDFRDWLGKDYLPLTAGVPDALGAERYQKWTRSWNGTTVNLDEAYEWAWSEYRDISAQLQTEASKILPDSTALDVMSYLGEQGDAADGTAEARAWLQDIMKQAVTDLDGTYFTIAERIRDVRARVDPDGKGATPYYVRPSLDFSRPGTTWLPAAGRTRFPLWSLRSVWYHEGVPGHHLQLAQWVLLADQLSRFQTSIGGVGACTEGWALYAERLMDELGYFTSPADRLGYLDWQFLRVIRVILDVGLHLGLRVPVDAPADAGKVWTPELARDFLKKCTRRSDNFIDKEIGRYLGRPGQAISYKLGERSWIMGREAARQARASRGESFDLKSWHMEALSLGSLGLDDLVAELSQL